MNSPQHKTTATFGIAFQNPDLCIRINANYYIVPYRDMKAQHLRVLHAQLRPADAMSPSRCGAVASWPHDAQVTLVPCLYILAHSGAGDHIVIIGRKEIA